MVSVRFMARSPLRIAAIRSADVGHPFACRMRARASSWALSTAAQLIPGPPRSLTAKASITPTSFWSALTSSSCVGRSCSLMFLVTEPGNDRLGLSGSVDSPRTSLFFPLCTFRMDASWPMPACHGLRVFYGRPRMWLSVGSLSRRACGSASTSRTASCLLLHHGYRVRCG